MRFHPPASPVWKGSTDLISLHSPRLLLVRFHKGKASKMVTRQAPEVAVLLFIFARPDHTRRVLEAIKKFKPPRLYIVADGPRPDRPGDMRLCAESREAALAVDWECDVITCFRPENLGLARSVVGGIDWFFNHEDCGIFLEDDNIPQESFFSYCEVLLSKYQDDSRIGMISGINHLNHDFGNDSYLFSKNKALWGWATWKRAWANMNLEMSWKDTPQKNLVLQNMGVSAISVAHWERAIAMIESKEVDTWGWPWYFSLACENQLTIFPRVNLVSNIGFGPEATHTKGRATARVMETHDVKFPLIHPLHVTPDYAWDEQFEQLNAIFGRKLSFPQRTRHGFVRAIEKIDRKLYPPAAALLSRLRRRFDSLRRT